MSEPRPTPMVPDDSRQTAPLKILVIGPIYPWPASFGGRMRLATTIDALRSVGTVDLFVAARDHNSQRDEPDEGTVRRLGVCDFPRFRRSVVERLSWFMRSDLPLELTGRDWSALRRAFADFVAGERYDVVWVSRLESYVAVAPLLNAPTILDLDNLEDDWHATRLSASETDGARDGFVGSLKRTQARRNIALWKKLQGTVARSVRATVVCSDTDRDRLGVSNAAVIPNSYERPLRPLGRVAVGDPPTVAFQGALWYGPNADAARYLVERVAPLLRDRLPDVRVRLIGRMAADADPFSRYPWVDTTGWVPMIEPELERADLLAVPIRFGGGTRIKILEAFAHRIPVVSTPLGAYGLEATAGQHLLLADTPERFAEACAELLTDEVKRETLADEAETLFLERYQRCTAQDSIRRVALSVA